MEVQLDFRHKMEVLFTVITANSKEPIEKIKKKLNTEGLEVEMKTHKDNTNNEDGFFYTVQISSDIKSRPAIVAMLKLMSGFKDYSKHFWSVKGLNHHRTYMYSEEGRPEEERSEEGKSEEGEEGRSEDAQPRNKVNLWKEHKNLRL